jgi:hypothetical protein
MSVEAEELTQSYRFAGSHVLRIRVATAGKLGVPFLDWRVSPRTLRERGRQVTNFAGCGLYGVCFRGRVVYVGSYCGKKPRGIKRGAYFGGDVVKSRWWQHFGSLTARSHRLHIAPSVLSELRSTLGKHHPMLVELVRAGPDIEKDGGCLGAKNRLLFAARNWERFRTTDPKRVLRQFSFLYARVDGAAIEYQPLDLERSVRAAESEAILAMQPEVNTAQRDGKATTRRLSARMALKELEHVLNRHLERFRQPL